mmetsp:Transcript_8680/g.12381  ORF Transcript_8680/g.12381 Transcript_8680/m.12381 type:complete len:270 (-) Transcript_8680:167-976(-)
MVCFRSILQSKNQRKKRKIGKIEENEALRQTKEIRATALYQMGIIQLKQAEQETALQSFSMCLKLRRSSYGNIHPAVAAVLQNMGVILLDEKKIARSLECFTESLQIRKLIHGRRHPKVVTSLRHIGRAHQECGDYTQALKYYQDALKILKTPPFHSPSTGGPNNDLIEILMGIGQTQQSLGLLDEAFKSYKEVERLLRRIKPPRRAGLQKTAFDSRIINTLKIMGDLALDMSDMERAMSFFAEAAKLSGKEEDRNLLINTIPPAAAAA